MKKLMSLLMVLAIMNLLFTACEKQEKDDPPELPPYESMAIDFSKFHVEDQKSTKNNLLEASANSLVFSNYEYAALNVGVWNLILTATLVVPVASFYNAFSHEPEFIGDATWQWTYTVNGFASAYTARLLGIVRATDVKWEMYITKSGIGAFSELLWFEGTSKLDRSGGEWTLYHSPEHYEQFFKIEWTRSGEDIGEITYIDIRDLTNEGATNPSKGSYIQGGYQDDYFDAYYNIHVYDATKTDFADVNIEWSTTLFDGHVKSLNYFSDTDWHCWDNTGEDMDCN